LRADKRIARCSNGNSGSSAGKNAEHIILVSPTGQVISIPNHDEVKRPTLKQVLRTCGIDDKAYRKAFDAV
jgi:hypothetical protein